MIHHGFKVVTTAGQAVPLASTRTMVSFITIYPRNIGNTTNVGEVRLGGAPSLASNGGTAGTTNIPQGSGMPLSPGSAGVIWPMPNSPSPIDLNTVYVDADNSNDGVQFIWGVP